MTKITDTNVKKELDKSNSTYYDWKKRAPREIALIKKGLLLEQLQDKKNNSLFIKE